MRGARVGAAAAAVLAAACSSIQPPTQTSIQINSCPDFPCGAYLQRGPYPACQQGTCVVAAPTTGLILVVNLPQDSFFAPGRTFAIPFEHLFDNATSGCVPPTCARLPPATLVSGMYLIDHSVEMLVGWSLGNTQSLTATALPVHATYVPLWADAGAATDQGLPLYPVGADAVVNPPFGGYPGPGGGPLIGFSAYLPPGSYERTLAPDPPFDQAYPPEIKQLTIAASGSVNSFGLVPLRTEADEVTGLTATAEEGAMRTLPTFDVIRPGGLDGWTAYLRDETTGQVISSVRTLGGTKTTGVILAQNRVPAPPDALCNAQLILAPPPGSPIPNGVFVPLGGVFGPQVPYPSLPAPTIVQGTVATHAGVAVEADLVFEATGIVDIVDNVGKLNTNGSFEFVARTQATRDPTSGNAVYSVTLPLGTYRVSIRPKDATGAVTIVDPSAPPFFQAFNVGVPEAVGNFDLVVDPPQLVHMRAVLTDTRPLGGATIEAIPTSCYAGTQPWCMPRGTQTVSASDGSIDQLLLDPGGYLIRVRPVGGSRLPWVTTPLTIPAISFSGTIDVEAGTIQVPAPVSAGLQLMDWNKNPIVSALVQVFTAPVQAAGAAPTTMPQTVCPATMTVPMTQAAVEVGNAVTDSNGNFDMFLAPPAD